MATYDAPIPNVAQYGQAGLLAKTAFQNTLARINRNRSSAVRQYGYLGDINPDTGVMQNLRVDPHNPYGNLQTMFRNHALAQQNAEFGAQERGLHGGLAHKAASNLRYAQGAESAQLGTTLTDSLADYQDQLTSAKYDFDRALYEAQLEQARNSIAGGDFNPAAGDGSAGVSTQDNSDGWSQVSPNASGSVDLRTVTGGGTPSNPIDAWAVAAIAAQNAGLKPKPKPKPKPYTAGGFRQVG